MCLVQKSYHNKDYEGIVNFFNNIPSHSFTEFISASAECHADWGPPLNILNYSITGTNHNNQFASLDSKENANITLKFKYPIYFNKYTLRTRTDGDNVNILNSWVVEGSLKDEKFEEIDSQDDNNILRNNLEATFSCKTPKLVTSIRIKLTKPSGKENDKDKWHLHLSRVEFYGTIYTLPTFTCPIFTCKLKNCRKYPIPIFYVVPLIL